MFLYLVAVFSNLTLSCFLTFTALFFIFFMVFLCGLLLTKTVLAQKSNHKKHSIKFDVAPTLVDEFMPYYEYLFHKKISAEIGVGFVTDNYLMNFVQESNNVQTRLQKMGPAFSLAARYYPYSAGSYILHSSYKIQEI